MAQRVNVVLVDDIDGSEATETVAFALDGNSYEIDLSAAHAAALRDALAPFVSGARKGGGARRGRGQRNGSAARGSRGSGDSGGPLASDVRRWARENGWDVPDRGRVSAEVREAYAAAHA